MNQDSNNYVNVELLQYKLRLYFYWALFATIIAGVSLFVLIAVTANSVTVNPTGI